MFRGDDDATASLFFLLPTTLYSEKKDNIVVSRRTQWRDTVSGEPEKCHSFERKKTASSKEFLLYFYLFRHGQTVFSVFSRLGLDRIGERRCRYTRCLLGCSTTDNRGRRQQQSAVFLTLVLIIISLVMPDHSTKVSSPLPSSGSI